MTPLEFLGQLVQFPKMDYVDFGSPWWWAYAGIAAGLVLFAGIMSGLTLGLMSLGLVDLEVLQRSGTFEQKQQAAAIFPVVRKQHQLLVTLLLCNAAAMEALPIFLDKIFNPVAAVILSVTFVLTFGEVIPQAICSRYGLAVGANLVWLVQILMLLCYPVAYPVGKVLDLMLGHNESALFRRAQLKALVSIHGQEAGKGGELTHDETTIISGALDLTEKTAEAAMTPIESTFSLDVNSKLDWEAIGKILARGHSRVPVFSGGPQNIIGLLLVKSLLTVRAETETPVSAISIRRIPRVPADMPLYDILNEFQKGSSHMAAVVRTKCKRKMQWNRSNMDAPSLDQGSSYIHIGNTRAGHSENRILKEKVKDTVDLENGQTDPSAQLLPGKPLEENQHFHESLQQEDFKRNFQDWQQEMEGREVIGIITLEDVIEELLQEEIVDETDEYVDVHKRIRVAATSIIKAPSARWVAASRTLGSIGHQSVQAVFSQNCNAGDLRKATNSCILKSQDSLNEPLLTKRQTVV
eukprot:c12983_g1_i1 orf=309-1877(-)